MIGKALQMPLLVYFGVKSKLGDEIRAGRGAQQPNEEAHNDNPTKCCGEGTRIAEYPPAPDPYTDEEHPEQCSEATRVEGEKPALHEERPVGGEDFGVGAAGESDE